VSVVAESLIDPDLAVRLLPAAPWCAACCEPWEGDSLDCDVCGERARVTNIGEQADAEIAMRERDAGVEVHWTRPQRRSVEP
jgi:hypothetical protein